jgi:hypothetical protein
MPILQFEPQFDPKDLAKHFGGRSNRTFSNALSLKTRHWRKKLIELIESRIFYAVHPVKEICESGIQLEADIRFNSPKLARTLSKCNEIVAFLGTIGPAIEEEICRLLDRRHVSEAFILDAMGSVAVENLVDRFHQRIREKYEGFNQLVSLRFSPGYCDWPVTGQKKLFKLLDATQVDVELTESCLMKPRKSISGVFGLHAENMDETDIYNPCADCRKRNCTHKRI